MGDHAARCTLRGSVARALHDTTSRPACLAPIHATGLGRSACLFLHRALMPFIFIFVSFRSSPQRGNQSRALCSIAGPAVF